MSDTRQIQFDTTWGAVRAVLTVPGMRDVMATAYDQCTDQDLLDEVHELAADIPVEESYAAKVEYYTYKVIDRTILRLSTRPYPKEYTTMPKNYPYMGCRDEMDDIRQQLARGLEYPDEYSLPKPPSQSPILLDFQRITMAYGIGGLKGAWFQAVINMIVRLYIHLMRAMNREDVQVNRIVADSLDGLLDVAAEIVNR